MTDSQPPSHETEKQKPVLTPPDAGETRNKDNRFTVLLLLIGLLVLLGVAAMVIWLLPLSGSREVESINRPASRINNTAIESTESQPDATGVLAKELLGEWLRLQARAEADDVSIWGADTYASIINETERADQYLREGEFSTAQAAYKMAVSDLQDLLGSKDERLAAALSEGEQALEYQDGIGAARAFDLALALDPGNQQAIRGTERGRNLDQVIALYKKGLASEQSNDLKAAKQHLQEAFALDGEFTPAGEALDRIENRILEKNFQEAMSRTLKALAAKDAVKARQALTEASRLHPSDISVKEAGQRLAVLEQVIKLEQLREEAEKSAVEERWADALQAYDKALAIDPQFGFAETGRNEAWQRYELDRTILEIMSRPHRLQEKALLDEAEKVLSTAQDLDNPGPRLQKQVADLSKIILAASTPVEIILRSDNETSVVIYRNGRFGKFMEKRVMLRPGIYTLVGSRPGFRDVRLNLKVQAENNPMIVDIRCEEPI